MKELNLIIEKAEFNDIPFVQELINELKNFENTIQSSDQQSEYSPPSAEVTISNEIEEGIWHNLIAKDEDSHRIVGFLRGTIQKDNIDGYGYVIQMYVKERFRGQRIGRSLIHNFAKTCLQFKVKSIVIPTLIANETARNFYKSVNALETVIELEASPEAIISGCEIINDRTD